MHFKVPHKNLPVVRGRKDSPAERVVVKTAHVVTVVVEGGRCPYGLGVVPFAQLSVPQLDSGVIRARNHWTMVKGGDESVTGVFVANETYLVDPICVLIEVGKQSILRKNG